MGDRRSKTRENRPGAADEFERFEFDFARGGTGMTTEALKSAEGFFNCVAARPESQAEESFAGTALRMTPSYPAYVRSKTRGKT